MVPPLTLGAPVSSPAAHHGVSLNPVTSGQNPHKDTNKMVTLDFDSSDSEDEQPLEASHHHGVLQFDNHNKLQYND